MVTCSIPPERREQPRRPSGLALLGEADRFERVEDRARRPPPRGRARPAPAPRHSGRRASGCRPARARARARAGAACSARSKLAVKPVARRPSASAAAPAWHGPAASRDAGGAAPRARRSPPRPRPSANCAAARPSRTDASFGASASARSNRSTAGSPASSARARALCAISASAARARPPCRTPRPPAPARRAGGGRGRAPATCAHRPGWSRRAGARQRQRLGRQALLDRRRRRPEHRIGALGVGGPQQPSAASAVTGPPAGRPDRSPPSPPPPPRARPPKVRMPGVDDQEHAQRIARIPRLMLDRVVEHPGLARLPRTPVSAPTRNQQPAGTISGRWQTSRVLATPVCGGMCAPGASSENIALGPRRGIGRLVKPAEQRHHRRAVAGIGLDRHAVLDEMDRGPGLAAVERGPLPAAARRRDIGYREPARPARPPSPGGNPRRSSAVAASSASSQGKSARS